MFRFLPAIPPRSDLDWSGYLRREGYLGEALERTLHDIGVMHPGGWSDWQDSTMTDTGAPVEMLFTAHQSSLALRTEVADPATDPVGRVEQVCGLISGLGGTAPPSAVRQVISVGQSAGALKYGAWLGLQRCKAKLGTTLYAEMPNGASDLIALLAPKTVTATLEGLAGETNFKTVTFNAVNGDIGLHFDATGHHAQIVPTLAKVAKASPEPLLADIQTMMVAGTKFGDPKCVLSFSYTIHRNTSVPTLTLFVSSKALFQNDAATEVMVRNYPGNHMAAYAGLVERLPQTTGGKMHHGNVGLRANGDAYPIISLGVAAPWDYPEDTF